LFVAATGHLLTAGSDRGNRAVLTVLTAVAAGTMFLLLFRLLHLPGHNRSGSPVRGQRLHAQLATSSTSTTVGAPDQGPDQCHRQERPASKRLGRR
jgi:hypothetical protein